MNLQSILSNIHVILYRLSHGKIGGRVHGAQVLLLTTTGWRTGKKHTIPLLYAKDGNRIAIVASNGGRDQTPHWWTNLQHNSEALAQIKKEKWSVKAEKSSTGEKDRLWRLVTSMYPTYANYQQKTKRVIPVIILTPSDSRRQKQLQ